MRILICDDDTLIIEQLKKYIESYFESNHLKCPELVSFTSGEALLTDKGEKDIVFLDIEMPGLNGINTATELIKRNPSVLIIIVTSHLDYLDDAMKIHVFRYLTKPVEKKRLSRSLADAVKIYAEANATAIVYLHLKMLMIRLMKVFLIRARIYLLYSSIRRLVQDHRIQRIFLTDLWI